MINIGKVKISTGNRTTVSSPNFEPKINISFDDLNNANTSTKINDGIVAYDAVNEEYVIKKLDASALDITNIDGGRF